MWISGFLILLFLVSLVSPKAIYDIHSLDTVNISDSFAVQRLRAASNAKILASGLKRLQPPKPIARKIVEGKKKRGNAIGASIVPM